MGLKFYSIAACQATDNSGEQLLIEGLDIHKLRGVLDEHDENSLYRQVGAVTFAKKIFKPEECENDYQKRCWSVAQAPFVYAECELADADGHPDAIAAAALMKFTSRPDILLKVGCSIDGGIIQRGGDGNKILERSVGTSIALTTKPCNERCKSFLFNDLQKSDLRMPPPPNYWTALKRKQKVSSITQTPGFDVYLAALKLKKSLEDFKGGFTSLKCWKCGTGIRFFKSSVDVPSSCGKCGESFSLSDIWGAFNK